MKPLITLLLLLITLPVFGQSYAGLGYQFGAQSIDSGNGASHALFIIGSFQPSSKSFEVKGESTGGTLRKIYLNRNGYFIRATGLGRYWIKGFAPQAGFNYGYFTVSGKDGYRKSGHSYFIGGAIQYSWKHNVRVIADYRYQPEVELHASALPSGETLDGYSKGQIGRVEFLLPISNDINNRFRYLVYSQFGRYVYRRAAVRYGAGAEAISHPYSVFELGIGIAVK